MSLPTDPTPAIRKAEQTFREYIDKAGCAATFTLRGGGTVNIKVADKWLNDEEMSAGLSQNRHRCVFMARDWTAGRHPEKGDHVTITGLRYGVMGMRPLRAINEILAYRVDLTG